MRNPNSYGSVVFLGKNRRKPYAVRKTVSMEIEAGVCRQKYRYFGYYATKKEALIGLANINEKRISVTAVDYTFGGMYEEWISRHSRGLAESSVKKIKSTYNKYGSSLSGVPITEITEGMLQEVIDGCSRAYQTQAAIKQLFVGIMAYVRSQGLRGDDPSAMLTVSGAKSVRPHFCFEPEAVEAIKSDPEAWTVLWLLYSGMRVEELLRVRMSAVHLDEAYLVGGIKTEAGKERVIPIHRYLLPFAEAAAGQRFLIEADGKRLSYKEYREIWDGIMNRHGLRYTPHDTRHTFITNMSLAGVPDLTVQKIVGHVPSSTTARVYTHAKVSDLVAAVNLLE